MLGGPGVVLSALLKTTIGKYAAGAILVAAIAYGPLMYLWGGMAKDASWRETLAAERAAFAERIEKADAVSAMQKASDARELAAYDALVEELRDDLEDASSVCFGGSDADRLRDLWR